MRRYTRHRMAEPSLVPLADMLTNTVGIIVFILIFTVLAAGGVVVAKRLPMEHPTGAEPVHLLCAAGRVLPIDNSTLTERFISTIGRPGSYGQVEGWLKTFNARRVENEYFVVTGQGTGHYSNLGFQKSVSLELAMVWTPRAGAGETAREVKAAGSKIRQLLAGQDPKKRFVHLIVHPDSLDAFEAVREAAAVLGFGTGWLPLKAGEPVKFSLTAGGRAATVQ